MNRTKIEWCDYSINPVKGLCPMACPYCYARRVYKRFGWNPVIRYNDWCWHDGNKIKPGSRVFVGSTMELFGPWVKDEWLQTIFDYCRACPSITFIFLTKKPGNLKKWSPFPPNCWVGVSATNRRMWYDAVWELQDVQASVKFISFEPLLNWDYLPKEGHNHTQFTTDWLRKAMIQWVLIGQQTPATKATTPKIGWIREIVEAADNAKIPVFIKDNLLPTLRGCVGANAPYWSQSVSAFPSVDKLRHEFPGIKVV